MSTDQLTKLFDLCEEEMYGNSTEDFHALGALTSAYMDPSFDDSLFATVREGRTLLSLCCGSGKVHSTLFLLARAPESAAVRSDYAFGSLPLHLAAGAGSKTMTAAVYKAYPSALHETSAEDETPLHWAVDSEAHKVVKFLLSKGANIYQDMFSTPSEFDTERSIKVRKYLTTAQKSRA